MNHVKKPVAVKASAPVVNFGNNLGHTKRGMTAISPIPVRRC